MIYLVHSEINLYNQPYQIISKIVFKYNKPNRSAIFNFNNLVSDLDIETCTLSPETVRTLKYVYPAAGHVFTDNLKIISDSRIRSIMAKGPKYRFSAKIDFPKCREKIAASPYEYCDHWCKREHVECDVKVLEIKYLQTFTRASQ